MNTNLKIAIIGDPNKGKSSLVSTLAYDDNVKISNRSGETRQAKCFPLKIDEELVYKLYDTPGFDNYEELLNFFDEFENKYQDFNSLVEVFIEKYQNNSEFSRDIEIYKVLMEKPLIIYVINSSESYKPEYEGQLEIIAKSKLPAFALFNQKGETNYKDTWSGVVRHYFLDSYDYNVLKVTFGKKIELFEMMKSKIKDENIKKQIEKSITILKEDFEVRKSFAFEELIDCFYKIITYEKEMPFQEDTQNQKQEYFQSIKKLEKEFYYNIERKWGFNNLLWEDIEKIKNIQIDSKIFTKTLGVSNKVLHILGVSVGAMSGGAIGLGFDTATLFGSLGIASTVGAVVGGTVGGVSSFLGTELINKKTKGLGVKKKNIYGPISDINWTLSLLSKFYLIVEEIISKSHADRTSIQSQKINDNLAELLFNTNLKTITKLTKEKNESKLKKELKKILTEVYKSRNKI